jgi:hypothetical protein
MCVAVAPNFDFGDLLSSTDPAAGGDAWKSISLPAPLIAVSCASEPLCVALGSGGPLFASNDPTGGARKWDPANPNPPGHLNAVSCVSRAFCITVGGKKNGKASIGTRPPGTRITEARIEPGKHEARFRFEGNGAPVTRFHCWLTRRAAGGGTRRSRCHSPKTYANLRPGRYLFTVLAGNWAGPDPTPARKRFRITG